MSTTAEQLGHTADIVERGWTQLTNWKDIDGVRCYCLSAALNEAAAGSEDEYMAARKFLIAAMEGISRTGLIWWNDNADRTQSEVVALCRKAAELARRSEHAIR